jgi:Acetyltransferase (GNAT) domain
METGSDDERGCTKALQIQSTIAMNSQAHVKVLRTLPELEEIRQEWEIWHGHRDSDIDFFAEVVKSNPCTIRPHVIVAYSDGKPDAALIGRIDATKLLLKIGYWRVPTPRVRLLVFVIGARRGNLSPGISELLFREALNSLRRREADVVRVDYVQTDSVLHHLASSLPCVIGRDYGAVSEPHWIMELRGTNQEIMQAFSADFRNQLRRKTKKIQRSFPDLSVKCFEKPDELDAMMRDVETVAAKSYQRGLQVGFLDNPTTRNTLSAQMARGRYLGYALYLQGKPSAFWLGSFLDSVFYSDYLAFDPTFSEYSPGTYLQTRVLEDLVIRQAARIDFGPGDARYKNQLGTTCQQEVTLHVFPSTFHGTVLNSLRILTTLGNKAAKAVAGRLGVLPRIKKAVRNRKSLSLKATLPVSADR